ncbi:hypothetical protein CV102_01810 [Natronococcus pandeyae]|uniref:Uncharacterized protein n=1 Tax=Natronococcus pandeyae TaxID=2055836 RepID=A0A8J8Q749_9EURY|nr:hypothetical protein [Natronococcus pandeyae]TYL40337.1 hypothetical protein CV102_01810 [Natronococcus pandeyae]
MDRLDVIAFVGFLGLVAASAVVDGIVVAAALAGFLLSLATWRLYDGRPWEALAWLAWVGTAVVLVIDPGGVVFPLAFFGFMLLGIGLLFGSRLDLLPDVWVVDRDSGE